MALNPPVNLFRRAYSKAEWEQIEDFLIEQLNSIQLPEQVTPQDIMALNARLDELATPVMWLYQQTKRTYEAIQMDRKNAEKQVYMIVKDAVDANGNPTGKKRTEGEIAAAIVEYLNQTPVGDYPNSIYVMEKAAMERYLFMDAVVSVLKQKAEKLITDLGAVKLEASLTANGVLDDDEVPAGRQVVASSRNR